MNDVQENIYKKYLKFKILHFRERKEKTSIPSDTELRDRLSKLKG